MIPRSLPLHYPDRSEFGDAAADVGVVEDVDDLEDVLVGLGLFFVEAGSTAASGNNPNESVMTRLDFVRRPAVCAKRLLRPKRGPRR